MPREAGRTAKVVLFCFGLTFISAQMGQAGEHTIMRMTPEKRREGIERMLASPSAYLDPAIKPKLGSFSLLSHLQYTPADRDPSRWRE